jgi:ribosomal protein S12 methylthiotransferase
MEKRFFLETLGCAKNQVDSEIMTAVLKKDGWTRTEDPSRSQVILINTCSFIQDAKQESIDTTLSMANTYQGVPVVMTGCMAQRYGQVLKDELPEVKGFFGNRQPHRISQYLDSFLGGGERLFLPNEQEFVPGTKRNLESYPGSAYLKLAEGCSHGCTFCAIPLIRGRLRSRTKEDILEEFHRLLDQGVKEFNLIAQDLAAFGMDRGKTEFVELLKEMLKDQRYFWLRCLYLFPETFPDSLVDLAVMDERLVPYFDTPVQHGANRVLAAMGRRSTMADLLDLSKKIRSKLPLAAVRSTFLVGFPGEELSDFHELLDYQQQAAFEWLGTFSYSQEEGTIAGRQQVNVGTKEAHRRKSVVEAAQVPITARRLSRYVGEKVKVLVEEKVAEDDLWLGRTPWQAPEVDGLTVIKASGLQPGSFVECKIIALNGIDFEAVPL